MATNSPIEWTTHTWSPLRGCTRVSPECDHCYAMNMAHRFSWGKHLTRRHAVRLPVLGSSERVLVDMVDWTGKVEQVPDELPTPLRWREPAKVFVCSGSDLFHPQAPMAYIAAVFGVMARARRHTFQVLTKRPERLPAFCRSLGPTWSTASKVIHDQAFEALLEAGHRRHAFDIMRDASPAWPLPNVWIGTSVGIRAAKPRIDALREMPAAVRFLSLEPLLEDLGELDLSGIGWVIAGGESGQRARPMHTDWVRSIRDQCDAVDVPFFFKQHGAYGPLEQLEQCRGRRHAFGDGVEVVRVGKKKAGRVLDGRLHDAMPA